MRTGLAAAAFATWSSAATAQIVLSAHPMPWNGAFGIPVAVFFDVTALRDPVVVEGVTTAMYLPAGTPFDFEVLIRNGTSLGGSATSGPGYSYAGWTSLGLANGVQGPVSGGVSLPVWIPRFVVEPGQTVGVALDFGDAPACFGDFSYANYEDSFVRLTTGDVRTPSFRPGQRYFPMVLLVGSIIYELDPCYPNCDGSTAAPVLNVNDFLCFMSKFAAGDSYANCDQSTTPPVLNVSDFLCFTQQFAGGCE